MILTDALILWCKKNKVSVRTLAKEAGIVHGTAANFLRGEQLNADNFALILAWAMKPTEEASQRSTKKSVPPAL